jgi:hypothetical protein
MPAVMSASLCERAYAHLGAILAGELASHKQAHNRPTSALMRLGVLLVGASSVRTGGIVTAVHFGSDASLLILLSACLCDAAWNEGLLSSQKVG